MDLVIVESPTKAKTISKFLDKNFKVESSFGHIRDLPKTNLGVDVKNNYKPKYLTPPKARNRVKQLTALAKKSDTIYLATDEDREGEAISWHLLSALKIKEEKTKRIAFHEITKSAILKAIENPRKINYDLVDAQQGRRILDRLVGYKLSPLLWKKIRRGLSAGRVQSVALKLIVDREKERQKFKPQEYWTIEAQLKKPKNVEDFLARLSKISGKTVGKLDISGEKQAKKIKTDLESSDFIITDVVKKEAKKSPYPPFTTSTLQQDAANRFGFSGKRTMMVAQQLYEGIKVGTEGQQGLITYMRTDSVNLSKEALKETGKVIKKELGAKYLLPKHRFFKNKSKNAQEAHEAIRPTKLIRTPDSIKADLSTDQFKLYDLIWRRTIACQTQEAILDRTAVQIRAGKYELKANGSIIKFPGWLDIYPTSTKEEILPPLKAKEKLDATKVLADQHFTEPPARFSDASLVKALEKEGIGRPSTYAPTIATILSRNYITKEGRYFKPEEIGIIVVDLLSEHFPKIVDLKFTAKMEDELDEVAEGKIAWEEVIDKFYKPFNKNLMAKEKTIEKHEEETDKKCPDCGKNLVIKFGKFGKFYACPGFPDCKYSEPIKDDNTKKMEAELAGEKCEKCKKDMVVKTGRFGPFLACSGYPECKNIKNIEKGTGAKCPKCGKGEIIEKRTRAGKIFYACNKYPKCENALWQKPTGDNCPECKDLLVFAAGEKIKCSNKECSFEKDQE